MASESDSALSSPLQAGSEPPRPKAHLVLQASEQEQVFDLIAGSCWTIGRDARNTIVIREQWVSRDHALIQRLQNGAFCLIDLGSRNGTFVNGARVVVPVYLREGDEVVFGETHLVFNCDAGPAAAPGVEDALQTEAWTAMLQVRRLISVMVVDIRDFSGLARRVDDTLLSQVMGTWFRRAGRIIERSGSRVDKYIGDAVMAVWIHLGDKPTEKSLFEILRAACDIEKVTSHLHQQFFLPAQVRLGVGINTGYAIVGNTGTGSHPEYTALGESVNAAFSLEAATKRLHQDVVLGQMTFEGFGPESRAGEFFQPCEVQLKGCEQPAPAWAAPFEQVRAFLELHTYKPTGTSGLVTGKRS